MYRPEDAVLEIRKLRKQLKEAKEGEQTLRSWIRGILAQEAANVGLRDELWERHEAMLEALREAIGEKKCEA